MGTEGELVEKIHFVEPLGKDTLLYFDHGGGDNLIAIVDGVSPYRAGDTLHAPEPRVRRADGESSC